jgi:hypothetical protein
MLNSELWPVALSFEGGIYPVNVPSTPIRNSAVNQIIALRWREQIGTLTFEFWDLSSLVCEDGRIASFPSRNRSLCLFVERIMSPSRVFLLVVTLSKPVWP